MNYSIYIDQKFAVENNLTTTEVLTLSAFLSLMTWTRKVANEGVVWYEYTERKMCDDFPLLFGCEKRVYKNISALAAKGFVQLSRFGGLKLVRFTEKCAFWGKEKPQSENGLHSPKTDNALSQNGQWSPKTDEKKSENGLIPPTPPNKEYILLNNQENKDKKTNIPPIIPLKGESPKKPKADFKKLADDFCNTIDGDDWRELIAYWLDYKIDIKKPLRCQKSLSMFENRLRRESGNDIEVARGFIDRAVSQGWQDIHPDAGKSYYEQKKDYERKEDERKTREWRAQEAERRAEAERQRAEDERRKQAERAEYERKYAEWQERERQRLAEEARKKAEYEQYLKDNDLPF